MIRLTYPTRTGSRERAERGFGPAGANGRPSGGAGRAVLAAAALAGRHPVGLLVCCRSVQGGGSTAIPGARPRSYCCRAALHYHLMSINFVEDDIAGQYDLLRCTMLGPRPVGTHRSGRAPAPPDPLRVWRREEAGSPTRRAESARRRRALVQKLISRQQLEN